jgi:hypothetical protein
MTRRTSLPYYSNAVSNNSGHVQTVINDLACGYLLEFPEDYKFCRHRNRYDNFKQIRSHRLSHPHLTFITTPSSKMSSSSPPFPTTTIPTRRYIPNGHRNSQPSLLFYGQPNDDEEIPPTKGILKHVPSQPLLTTFVGKYSTPKGNDINLVNKRHFSGPTTSTKHHYVPHHSPGTPPQSTIFSQTPGVKTNSPSGGRKFPKASEKRILQRHPQSDLAFRFQRHVDYYINENAQSRTEDAEVIDPVYLALKQATGRYGGSNSSRRGSSAHNFDSASPSPRNLSQVSLQDSGYAEISNSRNQLLGSTPMLDQPGMPPAKAMSNGLIPQRRRAPKLNKQMKSLSLDCAEMPPEMKCSTMRSPFKSKPIRQAQGFATSGETSDWERSLSPVGPSPRRLPPQPINRQPFNITTHVVTHEFSGNDFSLFLGERMNIVDNGDPDWLHGIRTGDRTKTLLTFPNTCVAPIMPGEQPMKLSQNVNLIESRLRLYRDQVVFAQPNSMRDDRVKVRNERGTIAECPLVYLTLL